MVVDTSALLAILCNEPDAEEYEAARELWSLSGRG